jgi:DHA3 family macrolide efflux protein-like MFS transporter
MSEETLTQLDNERDAVTTESIPIPAPNTGVPGQLAGGGGNAPEPMSMRAVLGVVTMRRLWYAQIVSVFGDFLALFAVITIMTFKLHATPQQITGINIAYLLPIALLGVISGVFVDRWPVKVTLVSSDFIRAGLCLLLFAVHNVYGFYAVLASISVISSFFSPAQGVAIRTAVPFHGLRSANALMQQVMFILRIIGGPIAITIVRIFGAKPCYALDALSFLASGSLIASLTLIVPKTPTSNTPTTPAPSTKEPSKIGRILTDMKVGSGFILHHAALLFVIVALAAGMFILGCFGPLIAIYVRDTLRTSSTVFAVTSAAIGIGLLIGVNVLNAYAKHIKNTTQVYLGLGGMALGLLLLAAGPLFAFTLPIAHLAMPIVVTVCGCFLIGFSCAGIIVPSQTLIQEETPPELMGRVGSTTMSVIFSAQIAGLLLSGILAEHTSVRSVFALCTAMLAVLILALA